MKLLPKVKPQVAALQFAPQENSNFLYPANNVSLLDYIISNMDINNVSTDVPHSTPTAYEQFTQMHTFLNAPGNWASVASVAIQNWRALITLLALNDFEGPYISTYTGNKNKYGIKFRRVPFNVVQTTRNNNSVWEADISKINNEFLKSAVSYAVLPEITESNTTFGAGNGTNWLTIYSIIFNYDDTMRTQWDKDSVIGLTSPYTISAPNKDFREIIPEGIFNFINFDSEFIDAVEADGNTFGSNTNELLAQQFVNFNNDSLKSVYEWLLRVHSNCPAGSVSRKAVDAFIDTIRFKIGNAHLNMQWAFANSHFKESAFSPDHDMGGFEKINFSTLKTPLDREWYALFAILALRELKGIKLAAQNNGMGLAANGVNIARKSEHSLFVPLPDIAEATNLDWIKKVGSDYSYALTPFECQCIIQWLNRVIQDARFATIQGHQNTEALTYANNFINIMTQQLAADGINVANTWTNNRFCNSEILGLNADLKVLQMSINSYNAPFFHDNNGIYQKELLKDWFNALAAIAFADIRDIKIENRLTDNGDSSLNIYDSPSELYINNYYNRVVFNFMNEELDNNGSRPPFAVTSRSTLLAVVNPESIQRCVLDSLMIPNEVDLPGRSNIKHRNALSGQINEFDSVLYDFEVVLYKKWLMQLIGRINANNTLLNNNMDKASIVNHLQNMISKLGAPLVNGIDNTEKDYLVLMNHYVHEDIRINDNSTVDLFNFVIRDKFFSKYLMYTDDPASEIKCDTKNKNTVNESVYSIHTKKDHVFSSENKGGMIIPPISVEASEWIFNNTKASKNNLDVGRFGLEYIKTYQGTFENESSLETVIQLTGVTVPLIRMFDVKRQIHRENITTMLPGVVVWPDIEIAQWVSYFVNIDQTNFDNIDLPKVSLPNFIKTHESVVKNEVVNFPLAEESAVTLRDVYFDSYRCEVYPLILRVDFNADGSTVCGHILVRPKATQHVKNTGRNLNESQIKENALLEIEQNREGFVDNTDGGSVIIGIDFGTTNTTAYMRPSGGVEEEIDFKLAGSNFITHGSFAFGDIGRPYGSLVAQAPMNDAQNRRIPISVLTSTMMKYSRSMGYPFTHFNIYRLAGHEIARERSLLTMEDNLFKHSMKWSNIQPADIKGFLLQITMMCCIAAIKKHRISSIELRVSYPISLPETNKLMIKKQWDSIISSELNRVSGIDAGATDSKYFYTESYASGNACTKSNNLYREGNNFILANPNDGFVCVDIGGGSTDISVFYMDSNPKQTLSIPFAGQLLLSASGVESYRTYIKKFLKSIQNKLTDKFKRQPTDKQEITAIASLRLGANSLLLGTSSRLDKAKDNAEFAFLADVIIGNFDYVYSAIEKASGNQNPDFGAFLSEFNDEDAKTCFAKIKFGLTSMAFFIGKMLKKMIDNGQFSLIRNETLKTYYLKLYFAGTGSKILDWFVPNDDRGLIDSQYGLEQTKVLLGRYIQEGLKEIIGEGDNLIIEIFRSQKPKQEVAIGLVNANHDCATFNTQGDESLVRVDIESLLFAAQREPRDPSFVFKDVVIDRLKDIKDNTGAAKYDIGRIQQLNREQEIFDTVTEMLNPIFLDHSELENEYFQIVGGFLKAFYSISPNDFRLIFPSIELNPHGDLNIGTNEPLIRHLSMQLPLLVDPINHVNRDELPMPIRDFLPFLVLKYTSLILKGVYKQNM